jgi:tRNA(adenine34) deaminase
LKKASAGRSRRELLALGAWAAFAPAMAQARDCDVCPVPEPDATQFEFAPPHRASPAACMQVAMDARAFAARRGDPAFGAAVVLDRLVAGAAPNRQLSGHDPTAHAEIEAIRDACRRLARARLDGALIYATSRPCRMCELACYHAGISRIIVGEALTDLGPPRNEAC